MSPSCTGSSHLPLSPSPSSTSQVSPSPSTCRPPRGRFWTPWGRCSSGWLRCSFTLRMRDGTCRHSRISSGFSLQVLDQYNNSNPCLYGLYNVYRIGFVFVVTGIFLYSDVLIMPYIRKRKEKQNTQSVTPWWGWVGLLRAINGCKLDFQF